MRKTRYLKYLEELYNYTSKYSGKFIYKVSVIELNELIEKLKADNWNKGKFCLGYIQWTGERTKKFKLIMKNVKTKKQLEQGSSMKGKMIKKELFLLFCL